MFSVDQDEQLFTFVVELLGGLGMGRGNGEAIEVGEGEAWLEEDRDIGQ